MPDGRDFTDQEIFDLFGVGTGDHAMRDFIKGQRVVNGHLYKAIDAILDHLTKDGTTTPELEAAKRRSEAVPDAPPACCSSNTGCS